ncbi:M56 family metallopeptidase [Flagellimonas myxillae]|uniref:M56 family metallopeptidase n=1 Tax=Flagellimonas myxillae TaxID=2942214 RepID=UPI00201F65FB|nr:M56 family metallopeptidase [Muricauda myxillae]MCL6267135.1 M56 family metallopeptidase [Muricauda myxillae]
MIQYVLESLVYQLVFLLTYDLLLKKETFFKWNRIYLLVSFILSLTLPWIKVDALKTTVAEESLAYPLVAWKLDEVVLTAESGVTQYFGVLSWELWAYVLGVLAMSCWFGYKLFQIFKLKRTGSKYPLNGYTRIDVPQSQTAFSFFHWVFIGEDIVPDKQEQIIAHERVHIKQRHSLDLLFFELMRIGMWFNPLVYIYQNRISELHEFMADAVVAKADRRSQYQSMLSEVFQTQQVSFINQFFKESLIKKRIVMLTKEESKAIHQLKYGLLLPLVLGMLVYTSCETEGDEQIPALEENTLDDAVVVGYSADGDGASFMEFNVEDLNNMSSEERSQQDKLLAELSASNTSTTVYIKDKVGNSIELTIKEGAIFSMSVNKQPGGSTLNLIEEDVAVPFAVVEETPIFPGCENVSDKSDCFMQSIQRHIRKNFRYPQEAQEKGIQGRVNVIFKISTEGDIIGLRMRGPHKLLEDEAARIIGLLPKMQPGKQKGHAVEVPFSIPITFKLQ